MIRSGDVRVELSGGCFPFSWWDGFDGALGWMDGWMAGWQFCWVIWAARAWFCCYFWAGLGAGVLGYWGAQGSGAESFFWGGVIALGLVYFRGSPC